MGSEFGKMDVETESGQIERNVDWDDIYIEDDHFYNHKNYKGYIREHPGNEDLPTDITGMDK